MLDILAYLPAKRKKAGSGWISFNAPCCIHNGESQDRRLRGGLMLNDQGWSFHCFNCGFKASFVLGRHLSFKARSFLRWINVPQEEIERVNLESLKQKSIIGILDDRQRVANEIQGIRFDDVEIPNAELVSPSDELQWDYLKSRHVPMDYPFMRSAPTVGREHIIIPFTYDNHIVGWASRFLDDHRPKYINNTQSGYVFGTDLQRAEWQYALVMEGVFDALSIGGLAVLHAEINDAQVKLIRNLGKEVIVVPDHDEAGMKLVDRAVELGWSVSMPEWPGCKDVNDAVIKYGKLATLITILNNKESSRIKIELKKKYILKNIQ